MLGINFRSSSRTLLKKWSALAVVGFVMTALQDEVGMNKVGDEKETVVQRQ